ncbi:hypothetical protein FRC03_010631 [Tulasnella sp. 419]|nr:hypothetical protein FRC03_010631 [Tulasnella sp. 419]
MNNHTIYIPDSGRKIITRWPILPKLHEPSIITPVSAIAQHKLLRFHFTADERWWVANGWTPGRQGGGTGLIEIRHVQSNQSRVVPGVACCIANVDVYDVRKELLVIADSSADKLSIRVEQLDPSAPGEPFKPVYISVDLLDPGDCPHVVKVFDHLPIIAVTTIHNAVYFFELHFGDYLFSQRIRPEEVWYNSVDQQSLLVHVISKGNIERVSVNTVDLIGYVRRVLKNDTLASGIAIRTGLSGAEDVIFDDMHREYRDIEDRHGP